MNPVSERHQESMEVIFSGAYNLLWTQHLIRDTIWRMRPDQLAQLPGLEVSLTFSYHAVAVCSQQIMNDQTLPLRQRILMVAFAQGLGQCAFELRNQSQS